MQNKNNGFSLIELSVVLVIIAIIYGITISIASTQIQFAKISNAQKTLTNAKTALATFKEKTGRLPCPANPTLASTNANYGLEVAGCDLAACPAGVVCPDAVQVQGVIPFKTINLSESAAYDSWNNKLSYIVDKYLTTIAAANNDGRIPVFDANGNEITASTVIGKATYILLSHGSDGKGAYKKDGTLRAACAGTESDVENCDGDAMIISRQIAATDNVATTANFYEDYLEVENQKLLQDVVVTPPAPTPPPFKYVKLSGSSINGGGGRYLALGNNGKIYQPNPLDYSKPRDISGVFNNWSAIYYSRNMGPWSENFCAMNINKKLFCRGSGGDGQNGNGTNNHEMTLKPVSYNYDWNKVATGIETVCGIRDNGKIYCWGKNDYGQLGIGLTPYNVNVPTEVTKDGISDWVDISASSSAFCAVRSTGQLYCWGVGEEISGGITRFGVSAANPDPVHINVHNDWAQVSISATQICALRTNGRAYCWGYNMYGELGNNTSQYSISITPSEIFGNHSDWTSIKTANNISCGIRNGGILYCWGRNDFGQLGDGTTILRNRPVPVFGGVNDWVDYTLFSMGGCGIRSDNKTYCWGRNVNGQLGDGTTINRSSPVEVIMPTP